jgi:nucleoside phosphorylase/uncharacterized LabA/DUF88 family protein
MSLDAQPADVRVFVDGDSLQYFAQQKLGMHFDAKDIFELISRFTDEQFKVNYYLEVHDDEGERLAHTLERGGLRVHITDLRDPHVAAYRGKSEEALANEARTILPTLKHLILVCGSLDKAGPFIGLLTAAKKAGCKTTVMSFSGQTPKKLGLAADHFVNVESAWTELTEQHGKTHHSKEGLMVTSGNQPEKPRVIIITMREDEYGAVLSRVNNRGFLNGKHWTYALGSLLTASGRDLSVAIARCPEQGPNEAHAIARNAIEDLDPEWIVLTGIGGGIPSDDFTLGDVVVATRLHDHSVGAHIEGAPPELSNRGGPMTRRAQLLVSHIEALKHNGVLGGWNSEDAIKIPRPAVDLSDSKFYGNTSWRKKTKDSLERHFVERPRPNPIVTTGAIASNGFLIKDTEIAGRWKQSSRDLLAMEMELSGVYSAARQLDKEYPILAIRGISDIVGYNRNSEWTTYACQTAGSFCVALLSNSPDHFLTSAPTERK